MSWLDIVFVVIRVKRRGAWVGQRGKRFVLNKRNNEEVCPEALVF